MSILDTILDNFLRDTGNDSIRDPNVRYARPEEQRKLQQGMVDIFKTNQAGQQVRLQRPENRVLQFGERLGLEAPKQQRDFGGFLMDKPLNILNMLGPITGLGSELWSKGLDIDLQQGQSVPNAVPGTVEFVGPRGGFGNQVRVKGDDGRTYWYSHLQTPNVQQGQRIGAGQPVGLGGNTGNVIPGGPTSDGSHLDLTVQDNRGTILPATAVRDLLKSFG